MKFIIYGFIKIETISIVLRIIKYKLIIKAMTFSGRLTNLMDEAKEKLSQLVRMHGETDKSKFGYIKVITISDDKLKYRMSSYHDNHLAEISQNELIDSGGNTYGADQMQPDDFFDLVDGLVRIYEPL